jgi:LytS/YehU family sensor histidine kinase
MLSVWLWALFTPFIFHLSTYLRFDKRSWTRTLVLHLTVGLMFAAVDAFVDNLLYPALLDAPRIGFLQRLRNELIINMLSYICVIGLAHALNYYKLFRAQEMRSVKLESKLATARVQALRSHLHPHFLFNTINAAAELTHDDPELADRMLMRLSRLLQRAFSESQLVQVPLERELSFAEQYLDIARIRFGDRLEIKVSVSDEAMRALVPSFVLQPLVENAIHHGVEQATGTVHVEVEAKRDDQRLHIAVSDTGPGLPADPAQLEWRTGMEKVSGLLQELYHNDHRLTLMQNSGGGAAARINIPYITRADAEGEQSESAVGDAQEASLRR